MNANIAEVLGQDTYDTFMESLVGLLVGQRGRNRANGRPIRVKEGVTTAIGFALDYGFMPGTDIKGIVSEEDGEFILNVIPGVSVFRHSLEAHNRLNGTTLMVEQEEIEDAAQKRSIFKAQFPNIEHSPDDRLCRSRLVDITHRRKLSADRMEQLNALQEAANLMTALGANDNEVADLRAEILGVASQKYDPPWIYTVWLKNAVNTGQTEKGKPVYIEDDTPHGRTAQWVANNRGFKAAIMDRIAMQPMNELTSDKRLKRLVQHVAQETEESNRDKKRDSAPLITADLHREPDGDILFAPTEQRTESGIFVTGPKLTGLQFEVDFQG